MIFEHSNDAILILDSAGKIMDFNRNVVSMLFPSSGIFNSKSDRNLRKSASIIGLASRVQEKWNKIEDEHSFLKTVAETGIIEDYEFTVRDGETAREVLLSANYVIRVNDDFIFYILKDITDLKKYRLELRQSNKMDALGNMAGCIAHDFNNTLMGIMGNVSLALNEDDIPAQVKNYINDIESYVKSASELTTQLLNFTKTKEVSRKKQDVIKLIHEVTNLFAKRKKDVLIKIEESAANRYCMINRGQIEQVFLNMFINAWHAMPDGGNINIRINDYKKNKYSSGENEDFLKISVSDTGTGIEKRLIDKVFEPFFTTKDKSKGTGLGLSSAYNIIKNHNGWIEVSSIVGKGTDFDIYIPCFNESGQIVTKYEKPAVKKGSGTVLIVDDEPMILKVGCKMLEKLGYTSLSADSGESAIQTYNTEKNKIDLIILDLIMPELSGEKVYERLMESGARQPFLISSGYKDNPGLDFLLKQENCYFISKPFDLSLLSRKISEILKLEQERI